MTTTARFNLTMDAADKDLVARAAALMGATMTGFVRAAAKEKALAMLDRESRVTFSQPDFAAFSKALGDAFKPNPALIGALVAANKSVSRV